MKKADTKKKTERIQLLNGCSCSKFTVHPSNWKEAGADPDITWYINYRFYDPAFPKPKQVLVKGMNIYSTLRDKRKTTEELLAVEKHAIVEKGYNPITGLFMVEVLVEPEPPLQERTEPILPEDGLWRAIIFARTTKVYDPETNTHKEVDSYLRKIMKAAQLLQLHTKPIGEFRRRDLLAIFKKAEEVKEWSCYSFNNCIGYIKPLFDILTLYEAMDANPVIGIPRRGNPKGDEMRSVMNADQRKLVDEHLKRTDRRFWLFMHIFFHSGAREIELLRLKRSDLDIKNQTFKVLVKKGNKKISARTETKTIKDIAMPFWIEYLNGYDDGEFIFSRKFIPGKSSISRDWLTHYWQKTVKIPLSIDEDFYSLKHLNFDETTQLLGMEAAAAFVGHTTTQMGKKHYAVGEKQRELDKLKKIGNSFAA